MSTITPGATKRDPYADWDAAYVLGALSAADRVLYEDHLARCDGCRRAVADLEGVPGLLSEVPTDEALTLLPEASAPGAAADGDTGAPARAEAKAAESHDIMGPMSPTRSERRRRARQASNRRPPNPTPSARARLAEAKRQQERRRRLGLMVGLPVAVVLVAVIAMVGIRLLRSGNTTQVASNDPAAVSKLVSTVPADVLNQVGVGTAKSMPEPVQAPPLTADGKPKVLYIGAEYCPFCASERWAVVVALSRFGSFDNLGLTSSSPSDVFPNTATLSFHGASYTSDSIAFTGVETQDREGNQLEQPSAEDEQVFSTYDFPPYVQGQGGSIPFVDIGGKYLIHGASYDPAVLKGKNQAEIAQALHDPSSPIAKAVGGTANLITAAVCATMDDPPADVCQSPGVQAAAEKLPS